MSMITFIRHKSIKKFKATTLFCIKNIVSFAALLYFWSKFKKHITMKRHLILLTVAASFIVSCGNQASQSKNEIPLPKKQIVLEDGGTGDFKAVMFEDSSLQAHTIFCPKDLSPFSKDNPLPVLVWGNGACYNSPHEHILFLNEIASHGYLVVATGYMPHDTVIYRGPMSKSEQQIESIDWAIAQNTNDKSYLCGKVNTKSIAAAGMSCGGLQTLFNCADPRLKTVMICNSGLFNNPGVAIPGMPMPEKSKLDELHTPIIYILGDTMDIAYNNGMDDYYRIKNVPACAANLPVGHGGTYAQPHGGEFSIVATAWLDWQLKGNAEAAKMFKGDKPGVLARKDWKFEKNDLIDK